MFLILDADLPDPLFCPNNCGRFYKGQFRRRSLKSHLNYKCGGQRKFNCSYCSKRFTQNRDLKAHCGCVHNIIVLWKQKLRLFCFILTKIVTKNVIAVKLMKIWSMHDSQTVCGKVNFKNTFKYIFFLLLLFILLFVLNTNMTLFIFLCWFSLRIPM